MKIIQIIIFSFIFNLSFSQDIIKKECAFENFLNITNNKYLIDEINDHIHLRNIANARIVGNDTTYTVQVVVHVLYNNDNPEENIPDDIIKSQIDALNRDFNALNDDSVNLRQEFIKFRGSSKIKFELAKIKPNGQPTNGITRKYTKSTDFSPNPLLEAHKQNDPLGRADWGGTVGWAVKKYLNIWVCNLNYTPLPGGGFLGGYAYPPAGLEHWNIKVIVGNDTIEQSNALNRGNNDGVCIDYRFFGQNNFFNQDSLGGSMRYGKGRTTVHEVGHYLGLRHTWGDAIDTFGIRTPSGCEVDDFIHDTPNSLKPYAIYFNRNNICDTFVNSCEVPNPDDGIDYFDMFENYMDYSTDQCYNLFTQQQVDFMRYTLTTRRPGIIIKREIDQISTPVKNNKVTLYTIYPNPAKEVVNIELNSVVDEGNIRIINTVGQTVANAFIYPSTTKYTIDVSTLSKGMYIISIATGDDIQSQRIVVE